MQAGTRTKALLALSALACAVGGAGGLAASSAASGPHVLYVAAKAKKSNKRCTRKAPCKSIARAIKLARPGYEVVVRHGTYREQVTVSKRITLVGSGKPVIDAKGHANGVLIAGAGAVKATVRGFVVQNASEEGILDSGVGFVTIRGNTVRSNDKGLSAVPLTGQCAPQGAVPGDCGEGLHLMGASDVRVEGNTVTANAGGILLTDEIGPSAHDKVAGNTVTGNVLDCGITLAGHSTKAATLSSAPGPPTVAGLAPTLGGVYDNTIQDNTVNGNGIKGLGAGIGMFGGAPGTAVYDNSVLDNTAEGNGLGGVTLHSHAPGQDLSGNTITGNILSGDGIAGYPNGAPGDEDVGLKETAAIILFSAATKLTGTTVQHNQISNEQIGIWTQNVPAIAKTANTFAATVKTPLVQK
jgi:parallel beta-helix repeat protein